MIQLTALGSIGLRGPDGNEIRSVLVQPKRLALLLYLVLASPRGFQRRDKLCSLFWPELDAAHSRNALNQALHVLRRGLGRGVLVSRGNEEVGIATGELACDVLEFVAACEEGRLREAMDLYRGDMLTSFFVSDAAPEFDRWVEEMRLRLVGNAEEACCTLAADAEERGDLGLALKWTRRASELAPHDEELQRWEMLLLANQGEPARALQAYADFAQRLACDLQVEPSSDLRALSQKIRSQAADRGPSDPLSERGDEVLERPPEPRNPSPFPGSIPPLRGGAAAQLAESPMPPVREVHSRAAASAAPAVVVPTLARPRRRPSAYRWRTPVAALAVAGLAAIAFAAANRDQVALIDKRVAVAPFENLTGDAALDPIGRMAADWITQGLTETDFIDVVDTQTAVAITRADADPRSGDSGERARSLLARETGAGTVVSGVYYLDRDTLRFQVQISDSGDGTILHALPPVSAHAESALDAIGLLRGQVLVLLADRLDPRLAFFETRLRKPPSYEAYRAYTEGLETFLAEDFVGAAARFDHAAELDSTFLRALLWAAQSHFYVGAIQSDTAHWERADSLLGTLGAARSRLSAYDRLHLDYVLAWRSMDRNAVYHVARLRALAAPGSVNAVREGGYNAIRLGHLREGIELLRRFDPTRGILRGHDSYWRHLTFARHQAGEHGKELRSARRGRAADPHSMHRLRNEAVALAAMGRTDDLHRLLDEALALGESSRVHAGNVMEAAARELRAHGYAEKAPAVVQRAVAWHRSRRPAEASSNRQREELADALYLAEDWEAARVIYDELAAERLPKAEVLGRLGAIAARSGDRERSREMARVLSENERQWLGIPNEEHGLARARIAAVSGEEEAALRLLEQHQSTWPISHTDEDLEPLWDEARFQKLLRREDRGTREHHIGQAVGR
jgi:DNA-binding SARP family transcriptional activator/tetratricopeptide (TPR) repeat protein